MILYYNIKSNSDHEQIYWETWKMTFNISQQ